jgi:SAM-dependent methyltransferase
MRRQGGFVRQLGDEADRPGEPAMPRQGAGGWEAEGDRLAAQALSVGRPTAWFDELYAAGRAGRVDMPWDRTEPNPLLADRLGERDGRGRSAVVVGCGLGADAELLGALGFRTTAFDVSPTAVETARQRYPHSTVRYEVADLLDLPPEWRAAFDLVVEIFTVQALPRQLRPAATAAVASLVASGGELWVISGIAEDDAAEPVGPPWPLRRTEVAAFAGGRLTVRRLERTTVPGYPDAHRWLAEFEAAG